MIKSLCFLSRPPEGNSWASFLGWTQVLHYKCVHIVVVSFKCLSVNISSSVWITAVSVCSTRAVDLRWPHSNVCVCVCWLTACQHSERTHMAGGWDIPARTPQAQTALLSRAAVAFTPGAPAGAQTFTQILCRLLTRSHRATARRYQRCSHSLFFCSLIFAVCLSLPLVVCLRVNSPQGAVASRQLMAGVGRDRGMRNACELERRGRTGGVGRSRGRGCFGH